MAVTLAQAQNSLKLWMDALERCSSGGTYSIAGRTLTRQDVPTIRAEIQRWSTTITQLEADAKGQVRRMGATASFPSPGSGSGGIISDELWRDYRT